MATPLRVLVHGGGIGGLTLAVALARRGHTVEVAELRDGLDALGVRRRPRAMWVQNMSRAILRQETGRATTETEDALLKIGIPGAAHLLVQPY